MPAWLCTVQQIKLKPFLTDILFYTIWIVGAIIIITYTFSFRDPYDNESMCVIRSTEQALESGRHLGWRVKIQVINNRLQLTNTDASLKEFSLQIYDNNYWENEKYKRSL